MVKKILLKNGSILLIKNLFGKNIGELYVNDKLSLSYSTEQLENGISISDSSIRIEYIKKFFLLEGILNVYLDNNISNESDLSQKSIVEYFRNISLVFILGSIFHLCVLLLLQNTELSIYVWGIIKSFSLLISLEKPHFYLIVLGVSLPLFIFIVLKNGKSYNQKRIAIILLILLALIDTTLFCLSYSGLQIFILIVRYFILAKPLYLLFYVRRLKT